MPRDVLPGAYAVMEEEFDGDSMIPHRTDVGKEGESRVSTPSGETHEIKVSYVPRASFYNIIDRTEHGDIIGTV